jgi:hypothetical protein
MQIGMFYRYEQIGTQICGSISLKMEWETDPQN